MGEAVEAGGGIFPLSFASARSLASSTVSLRLNSGTYSTRYFPSGEAPVRRLHRGFDRWGASHTQRDGTPAMGQGFRRGTDFDRRWVGMSRTGRASVYYTGRWIVEVGGVHHPAHLNASPWV